MWQGDNSQEASLPHRAGDDIHSKSSLNLKSVQFFFILFCNTVQLVCVMFIITLINFAECYSDFQLIVLVLRQL